VLRWAEANKTTIYDALTRASEINQLSETGREGLGRLGGQLQGLANASPWTCLTSWLFERSDYLKPLLLANDAVAQQKLIAIYQLLKVCGEQVAMGDSSRKSFLARIRRIEALNQDSSYRAIASEAADMDAVRVMTIHGSKGLEFGAIHFPALATRYMPTSRQGTRCPPPPSLSHLTMQSGAFPKDRQDGRVAVSYQIDGSDWKLVVSDNGIGKPDVARRTSMRRSKSSAAREA
jgi:DNA helicase II / ATP-dependent DNA helicase PcrA